jgi:hypothetical protein
LPHAVSAVLVTERQEEHQKKQLPIYYISKNPNGTKKFYTEMEKVSYVVVIASRKLKHYFQAHRITIPSSFPLENIFKNPEAIGRIGKWATKINEFTIEFVGRHTIKSQALTEFVADWTPGSHNIVEVREPI